MAPWSSGWGLGWGLIPLTRETMLLQKLEAEKIHFIKGTLWPVVLTIGVTMMRGGQNQQVASELKGPLVHRKNIMKIGKWNGIPWLNKVTYLLTDWLN